MPERPPPSPCTPGSESTPRSRRDRPHRPVRPPRRRRPRRPAGPRRADVVPGEVDATLADGYAPGPDDLDPYRPPSGVFLLATARGGELDGEVLGCGALRDLGDGSAEVKRMWVDGRARGTGLGRRLLSALEEHARDLGYQRVRLDTNDQLVAALALYRSAGYAEVERYNDNPHARHWFEKVVDPADPGERP